MQVACGAYYSSTVGALRSGCLPIYRGLLAPCPSNQTCNASDTGLLSTLIYQSWLLEASLPEGSGQRRSHVAIVYEGDKLPKDRLEITFQLSISHSSAVSNPPCWAQNIPQSDSIKPKRTQPWAASTAA